MLVVFLYITEFLKIPILYVILLPIQKGNIVPMQQLKKSDKHKFIFKLATSILKLSLIFTVRQYIYFVLLF